MAGLKYWDVASNQYVLLMPGTPTTFPLTYMQTLSAPTVASSPYQVSHSLNTTTPLVQAYDAVTGQQIMVQVTVANNNAIQIRVQQNCPNNVNVIVMGTAQSPVPINPADYANKSYVDARTPNLPAPVSPLSTTLQTFTDVLGAVWVAIGSVSSGAWKRASDALRARAFPTANTTMPSTGFTAIALPSTASPGYDNYGLMSNNRFTCPIPGMYRVQATLGFTAVVARYIATLYKNGAEIARGGDLQNTAANIMSLVVSDTLLCAANDYIQLYGYSSVTTSSYFGSAAGTLTFLTVVYDGTG